MAVNSKFKIPNARELLKSFKNARAGWKLKTPMQKWCYFYSFGRTAYGSVRVSILNDVHKVHWFGYCVSVTSSISILLSLYTVLYYTIHGELQMGLPSTCMACIYLGVCSRKLLYVSIEIECMHENRIASVSLFH